MLDFTIWFYTTLDLLVLRSKLRFNLPTKNSDIFYMKQVLASVCRQISLCVFVCAHTPAHGSTWAKNIPCIRMFCFPVGEAPGLLTLVRNFFMKPQWNKFNNFEPYRCGAPIRQNKQGGSGYLTSPFPRKLQMFGAFEPDSYVDCTPVLPHSFFAGIRENYSEYDHYSFKIARHCGRIPFLRYLVR
jgi:hypothetical protein